MNDFLSELNIHLVKMAANNRSGRTEEQRMLLKALHDVTKGGERGGVLQPVLTNIRDRSDRLEPLNDEDITRAARKLHREGIMPSERGPGTANSVKSLSQPPSTTLNNLSNNDSRRPLWIQ